VDVLSHRAVFLWRLEEEAEPFTRLLAALPEGGLDYRPDPVSRTGRRIVAHLLAEMKGLAALARTGVWDYLDEVVFPDVPAALASFQEAHSAAVAGLRAWEDGAWEAAVATIRMDGAASEMPLPGLC
jgi:hypothetical protein